MHLDFVWYFCTIQSQELFIFLPVNVILFVLPTPPLSLSHPSTLLLSLTLSLSLSLLLPSLLFYVY